MVSLVGFSFDWAFACCSFPLLCFFSKLAFIHKFSLKFFCHWKDDVKWLLSEYFLVVAMFTLVSQVFLAYLSLFPLSTSEHNNKQ